MAIFGAGSLWDNKELKDTFFKNDYYLIGWDLLEAKDLYSLISTIKVGDIIYLKANKPGSLNIRIKGIGIVTNSLLHNLLGEETMKKRSGYELPVKWIIQEEQVLTIPKNSGKLTNIRAATLYEEYMPFVQTQILKALFINL